VTLRSGLHRKKYWAILRGTGISESIRVIDVSYSLQGMLARQAPTPKLRDNRKRPSKRWNFKHPIDRPAHDNQHDCLERRAWIQISHLETRCCPGTEATRATSQRKPPTAVLRGTDGIINAAIATAIAKVNPDPWTCS